VFVPYTATMAQALAPLRADPGSAAVLLDVDGTLAPIVQRSEEASVPEATRTILIELTTRYGLVACISGRRAQEARQIVAIGSIAYVGNHGAELLAPGSTEPRTLDHALDGWVQRVGSFSSEALAGPLRGMGVRYEDKGAVAGFHWRGVRDEGAAEEALKLVAEGAQEQGLTLYWGRKVLEVRAPVALHKGLGVSALLAENQQQGAAASIATAVYVGDDRTDLDAFAQLRAMVAEESLRFALCVGVTSDETPSALIEQADITVAGTGEVRALLAALL
jgi:trehalose 6-phosphate phosphatase